MSTQQVLAVLDAMGISHGMDKGLLHEAHSFLETAVGRELEADASYKHARA